MDKEELLREVKGILSRGGFVIGEPLRRSMVFDLIARRDSTILILKILLNADSLRGEMAREMKILAHQFKGAPLVVCLKTGAGENMRGVIYSRHGVPVISLETFWDLIIEETPPMVFVAPGGFYVNLNGKKLRDIREARGISLGELARMVGVSRKAIQLYEAGMSATVDMALRLEEVLGEELIEPIDLFHYSDFTEHENSFSKIMFEDVYRRLVDMGYDVFLTLKCPFEAISKDREEVMLTGFEKSEKALKIKTQNIRIFSEILGKRGFIVMSESSYEDYNGVAIIRKKEIMSYTKEELKKTVEERSSI
ncbi:MAG: transcriptional regulator [Euryarchaeota archaeon]|nr:transcriptional regulator [Euryarchaeota archaeon]